MIAFVPFVSFAQQNDTLEIHRNAEGKIRFARFRANDKIQLQNVPVFLKTLLQANDNDSFKLLRKTTDIHGITHQRFQQYYNGIKVEDAQYLTHGRNGMIETINGDFKKVDISSVAPTINEQTALGKALNYVKAKKYKWEDPGMETFVKKNTSNPNATYYPNGEIVITRDFINGGKSLKLAWKFTISSLNPSNEQEIYVDAKNGDIIRNTPLILDANPPATAQTKYSGVQNIIGDSFNGSYRLRENRNGVNLLTLNMQNSTTNYAGATDFTNFNTNWASGSWTNFTQDQAALDAHWGAEVVLDYWHDVHNRNSIDNNGIRMLSYVHYSTNWNNAQWVGGLNSHFMQYGDGNNKALTALDVCAHEIGHGIAEFTANLTPGTQESGALNEGLSDIWAACIEHWGTPNKQMWKMGEELSTSPNNCIRDMENPKSTTASEGQHPNTYQGQFWSSVGEPHYNSTVLSHWFYLLSEGGFGTNDIGNSYNVTGIGIDEAAKIVYYAETQFLTPSSNYADARDAMISASSYLFCGNSSETIAATNAWYAVGVGGVYSGSNAPAISGPSSFCATANYAITNLPSGASVVWSYNILAGSGTVTLTPSGTSVSVATTGGIKVNLTAHASTSSCSYSNLNIVFLAGPPIASLLSVNGDLNISLQGPGQAAYYGYAYNGVVCAISGIIATQYQIVGNYTAAQAGGMACTPNHTQGKSIIWGSSGMRSIQVRIENSCGWSG